MTDRVCPVYEQLSSALLARLNCMRSSHWDWVPKHEARAQALVKRYLPSGSGFDVGTRLDMEASTPERLVLKTSFHHMTETGYYDGWTDHQIIVTPSLTFGIALRITGRNRNDIKDYLSEVFDMALRAAVPVPSAAAADA